jgi:hypothetical protein
MEMGALTAHSLQVDARRDLYPDCRLCTDVTRKDAIDSSRGDRFVAIIDPLRRPLFLHQFPESGDLSIAILVEIPEYLGFTEQNRLELIKLNVRNKSGIIHVGCPGLLDDTDTLVGNVTNSQGLVTPRKVRRKGIKVKQGGEANAWTMMLFEQNAKVMPE